MDLKDVPWAKQPYRAGGAVGARLHRAQWDLFFVFSRRLAGTQTAHRRGDFALLPTGRLYPKKVSSPGRKASIRACLLTTTDKPICIWAGAGCQVIKLKPNMIESDGPVQKIAGLKNFFEGPSLIKRDGNYYLTYPARRKGGSGDGGSGQNYDYAMGQSPLGPFDYKGSFSTSELGGNIHGSLVEYGGKWYCVYHDYSTSVGQPKAGFKRALRLDEIHFNADGTLAPLVWTTSGPPKLKNLDPFARVEAETLAQTDLPTGAHAVNVEACSEGGADVGALGNGDWLKYANVDFGGGAQSFSARVASPFGARLELRMDSSSGPIIGTCEVPNTGGWQNWQTANCPIALAKGVRDLYLIARSESAGDRLNLNWWQFAPLPK